MDTRFLPERFHTYTHKSVISAGLGERKKFKPMKNICKELYLFKVDSGFVDFFCKLICYICEYVVANCKLENKLLMYVLRI